MGLSKPLLSISPAWEKRSLLDATSNRDVNSIATSVTNNGSFNSVTIDKNKASAYATATAAATWFFALGVDAVDKFSFQGLIEINNTAALSSSNIIIHAGLTTNVNDPSAAGWGCGINYQLANPRVTSYRNASVAGTGFQTASNRGIIYDMVRCGGTSANTGNIAYYACCQSIDSNGDGLNDGIAPSGTLNANATTDDVYFYVTVGFAATAASSSTIEFNVLHCPIIKR